jgi:AraC-like DNA-binding protein
MVTVVFGFGAAVHVTDAVDHRLIGAFTSLVCGLRTRATIGDHAGQVCGIEVHMTPLAAFRMFGIPMKELAGHIVALTDLPELGGAYLVERLAGCPDWTRRFQILDEVLTARWRAGPRWRSEVAWAWRELVGTSGQAPVEGLASRLGWTRRNLERRFREQVGVPPKSFAQVLRLQNALRIQDAGLPWAQVAAEAGYYDQAHLGHTWKTMIGCTPSHFRASRRSSGDGAPIDRIPGQVTSAIQVGGSHSYKPKSTAATDDVSVYWP